jgi:hypothetical protein
MLDEVKCRPTLETESGKLISTKLVVSMLLRCKQVKKLFILPEVF